MNNAYHQSQIQLQTTLTRLQNSHNQFQHARIQNIEIQKELDRERGACELANQQFAELKEDHGNLQKSHKEAIAAQIQLTKSLEECHAYTKEVVRQAENIIDGRRTEPGEEGVGEEHHGQSIKSMILQSAKNTLLAEATTRGYSETDVIYKLKYAMDQNAESQLQIEGLSNAMKARDDELEARNKELEAQNKEIASLNKALELAAEGGKPKRSRRGVKQRKLLPREDST